MRFNWSRRTLLANLGVVSLGGLTGCSRSLSSGRGATDIVLHNEAANRRHIDVTVTSQSDDSTKVDRGIELEPNARHTINNEVLMGSDYDVEVAFTDETTSSPYTETQEWNDAGKPLHVIVHEQIVFAVQIG